MQNTRSRSHREWRLYQTAGTGLSSYFEREAAEVLGIPYEHVMQAALIPVAFTLGTDFKQVQQTSYTLNTFV